MNIIGLWARKYDKKSWSEFFFRFFYGLFFFIAGVGHAFSFETTKDGAGILGSESLAPYLALGAISSLMLGGLSLMTGYRARWGAFFIIVFLIPATQLHAVVMEIAINNFTSLSVEASAKAGQTLNSLLNIAVQGHQGNYVKNLVLLIAAVSFVIGGAGPISFDHRCMARRATSAGD